MNFNDWLTEELEDMHNKTLLDEDERLDAFRPNEDDFVDENASDRYEMETP